MPIYTSLCTCLHTCLYTCRHTRPYPCPYTGTCIIHSSRVGAWNLMRRRSVYLFFLSRVTSLFIEGHTFFVSRALSRRDIRRPSSGDTLAMHYNDHHKSACFLHNDDDDDYRRSFARDWGTCTIEGFDRLAIEYPPKKNNGKGTKG